MATALQNDGEHDLLAALQAHGQQFLNSFGSIHEGPKKKRRKLDPEQKLDDEEEDEASEWNGFDEHISLHSGSGSEDDEADSSSVGHSDDEFRSDRPAGQAQVVVFSAETSQSHSARLPPTKAQVKAFMSSKVSKLRQDTGPVQVANPRTVDEEEYEEERSNVQNDALLHKLVHTKLLSGSFNPELDLTPAQRRKALAGRILELTGGVKLGKGEATVRRDERNQASKSVRVGMVRKREERSVKELEEAKNMGNYHHSIKGLFEASSTGQDVSRKRDRGLKMGVGRFSGGVLKLSREEIAAVQSSGGSGRGERGRGRSRGRGRGRANGTGRGRSRGRGG